LVDDADADEDGPAAGNDNRTGKNCGKTDDVSGN